MIYALVDPFSLQVKYIGQTRNLRKRMILHVSAKEVNANYPKAIWVRELLLRGRKPAVKVLDYASSLDWKEKEMLWISIFRKSSTELLNVTDGGYGLKGCTFTQEHRMRLSQSTKGKKKPSLSAAARKKISLGLRKRSSSHPATKEPKTKLGMAVKSGWEKRGSRPDNKVGIRGISLRRYGTYRVRVTEKGVRITVGTYPSLAEAICALEERRTSHGE